MERRFCGEWYERWAFFEHGSARRRVSVGGISVDGARSLRSTAQSMEGVGVDVLPWIGAAHLEQDAAHADADDGADLEQLEADGVYLRLGPFRSLQGQAAQSFDQGIGQRGEVEAQLVAFHLVSGEPVGEQAHLLLDAILHLPAGAVELLV